MSRLEKINAVLRKEISEILLRRINDSRIGFISITYVNVSKDLEHAWIYYSQIGSEDDKYKTQRGLQSATKFIQGELGKVLKFSKVPRLHFKFDDSIEKGSKIIQKINELNK